jgi:hypothetical protein
MGGHTRPNSEPSRLPGRYQAIASATSKNFEIASGLGIEGDFFPQPL